METISTTMYGILVNNAWPRRTSLDSWVVPLQKRTIAALIVVLTCAVVSPSIAAPVRANIPDGLGRHHKEQAITHPSRIDSSGNHLTYDLRGSLHNTRRATAQPTDQRTYFHVEAFDQNFFLNVSANRDFISRHLVVEYVRQNSSVTETLSSVDHDCYHTGHLGDGEGWVAISTCHGMHGVIATNTDYYFIEPLAKEQKHKEASQLAEQQPHVVYRGLPRDTQDKSSCTSASTRGEAHPNLDERDPHRIKRSHENFVVKDHFIETTIVTDESMSDHHGTQNLRPYLFTLMNVVAHLYRDSTIGHAMNIVLVKVIVLEELNQELKISQDAETLLHDFCSWQQHSNGDEAGPHHDIAVLVTRTNICEGSETNCGILGMAELSGACNPKRCCSVNEDTGLSTAFTIAHEIGHNLGMPHDGVTSSDCQLDAHYLMAPSFAQSVNPHHWSSCSSLQLERFLESSTCLGNHPDDNYLLNSSGEIEEEELSGEGGISSFLPGMEYSRTEQCQLLYGDSTSHCQGKEDDCRVLWCRMSGSHSCTNQHSPPAPGTECITATTGDTGVCYQGDCVQYEDIAVPVGGQWGDWGEWHACSQPCGMGVQYRERHCDSPRPANGGKYCLGPRRNYQTCIGDPCPEGKDVRQELCETDPPHTLYSEWEVPSLEYLLGHDIDSCKRSCIAKDNGFLFTDTKALPDGLSCIHAASESLGLCVAGQCVPIGCDFTLNEHSKRDECGVWCGSGSTCVSIAGNYTSAHSYATTYTYYDVIAIPSGSTGITIEELKLSPHTYLAAHTSSYLFNGHFRVVRSQLDSYWFAGASWWYERSHDRLEFLRTQGPTTEEVVVQLLSNKDENGVKITFSAPKYSLQTLDSTISKNLLSLYYWNSTAWGECEAVCGEGLMRREVNCLMLGGDGSPMNISYCDPDRKPAEVQACHTGSCHWATGEWTKCDTPCGSGVQTRSVSCQQSGSPVSDGYCEEALKPSSLQSCQNPSCHWVVGEWSECSALCGEGSTTRLVSCQGDAENGEVIVADDTYCNMTAKPQAILSCTLGTCQWATSDWEECDAVCGNGNQLRRVSCHRTVGNGSTAVVTDSYCDSALRPPSIESCQAASCQWKITEWTECDAFCGEGTENRQVFCERSANDHTSLVVSDAHCDHSLRPADIRLCEVAVCQWGVSQWTECDAFCGEGTENRQVFCERSGNDHTSMVVSDVHCDHSLRPADIRLCEAAVCQWGVSQWTECDAVCGDGSQTRNISCERVSKIDGTSATVESAYCSLEHRPLTTRGCQLPPCLWTNMEWSQCNVPCGNGIMVRQVLCQSLGEKVSEKYCSYIPKPQETQVCQAELCENYHWTTSEWAECSESCGEGSQFRSVSCEHQNGTAVANMYCEWDNGDLNQPETSRTCTGTNCCSDSKTDSFCVTVVRYNLCHIFGSECCDSCSGP